jgi:tetratricopeptide (TPR) repeat protein
MSLPDLQEPLALLEQKDFDKAIDVLEQKVTALPAHLGAHVLLAYAHEGRQQWEEALGSWEEVHFLLPNSPIASAGKQRVLRRMDGIEGGVEAPRPADGHPVRPADTASRRPAEDDTDADDGAEADADERQERPEAEDPGPEASSSTTDDGLAQLRRQAEREARQGGARPGLADASSSVDAPPPPDDPSSTPEEQVEQFKEEESSDDLDHLIDKLESTRIEPDPDAEPEPRPEDPTPEDDTEEVVSETLARIHEGQNDYQKAAHIYAKLADQEPHRADEFRQKAQETRRKADASGDSAA